MDDSIITKTPNPILTKRDFCLTNKPNITCSIPTINRIIPAINTIETVASAGLLIRIKIDSITATAPKPICAPRIQPGDFSSSIWNHEILATSHIKLFPKSKIIILKRDTEIIHATNLLDDGRDISVN